MVLTTTFLGSSSPLARGLLKLVEHPLVMFSVLKITFGKHPVAYSLRVSRQHLELFQHLLGMIADLLLIATIVAAATMAAAFLDATALRSPRILRPVHQ